MLLTVVIYVLLGYEDNNMWFGSVSSLIMERHGEAIFLLWAAKWGLQSFFVIRSTAWMPSKIGMLLVPNRSCFLGVLLENAQMWRTGKATMLFVDVDAVDGANWVQTYTYAFACRRMHMWRFVWIILLRTAVSTLEACLLRASSRHPPVADKECWWK